MLVDVQGGEAGGELGAASWVESLGWPLFGVGRAPLAGRHRHDDDPAPSAPSRRHQSGGEVRLVVGMRPHPEKRSGAHRSTGPSCVATSADD